MKISCGVAGDLLPLYVDGCCSEESGALLTEHLGECQKCREKWERMKRSDFLPEQGETQEERRVEQTLPIIAYADKIRRRRTLVRVLLPVVILLLALMLSVTWQAVKLMAYQNGTPEMIAEAGSWDSKTGELETDVRQIETYRLHAAASRLAVHVQTEAAASGKVVLYKAEEQSGQNAEEPIMTADINGSSAWCVFTHLSAESCYRVRVEGIPEGTVTVSGKFTFPQALRMAWEDFFLI